MREQLATEDGRAVYPRRKSLIEPVFGQIKHSRRIDRFTRRGLAACPAQWWLVIATTTAQRSTPTRLRPPDLGMPP